MSEALKPTLGEQTQEAMKPTKWDNLANPNETWQEHLKTADSLKNHTIGQNIESPNSIPSELSDAIKYCIEEQEDSGYINLLDNYGENLLNLTSTKDGALAVKEKLDTILKNTLMRENEISEEQWADVHSEYGQNFSSENLCLNCFDSAFSPFYTSGDSTRRINFAVSLAKNLGVELPIQDTPLSREILGGDDRMSLYIQKQMASSGLLSKDIIKSIDQNKLKNRDIDPTKFSQSAREYWAYQSQLLGENAVCLAASGEFRYGHFDNRLNPDGTPTDELFIGVLKDIAKKPLLFNEERESQKKEKWKTIDLKRAELQFLQHNQSRLTDKKAKILANIVSKNDNLNDDDRVLELSDLADKIAYNSFYIDEYFQPDGNLKRNFFANVLGNTEAETLANCLGPQLQQANFTPEEISYLKTPADYREVISRFCEEESVINGKPPDYRHTISQYFDEKGAKPELYQFMFNQGRFDVIADKPLFESQDSGLDEKQTKIIAEYQKLATPEERKILLEFIGTDYNRIPLSCIEIASSVASRLFMSNAEEIHSHSREFATQIFNTYSGDNQVLFEKIDRIENIFLHNNLPYIGKVFSTFRTLYPHGETHSASQVMERGALKGLPETGYKSKDTVLFNDLLKASILSGNRNLKHYLKNLQLGENLSQRAISGETNFTAEETAILGNYAEHLATIYNNTEQGRNHPIQTSGDSLEDIKSLSAIFAPTFRHSVPDRIVRSFGFGLDINSCQEMLDRMDSTVKEADARNRAAAKAGNFTLQSGDLIKAVNIEYFDDILQNGSVAKEFLNGQQNSDSTPLDTDLNVLPAGLSGNISEGVDKKNEIANFGAMHLMMVMKGDGNPGGRNRFQMETPGQGNIYDPNKYEVWQNSEDNQGIRTGFASTEIDYLIYDDFEQSTDKFGDFERVKFDVAQNDFYIPIVDKTTGKLIFTPEEYDRLHDKKRGLKHYDAPEYRFADNLSLSGYTIGDVVIPSTKEIIAQSQDNRAAVDEKRGAIISQVVQPVISGLGLAYKDYLDGDLTLGIAEVIDTGSTGRYSNAPGDGDFDFMMKLDRSDFVDEGRLDTIRRQLLDAMGISGADQASVIRNGNIRAKDVRLSGLSSPVDIDITFAQKTNKVNYSSDMALKEYYESMREVSPERTQEVVANVVFAKQFMKAINAYKPSRSDEAQGGMGGIGIENWIVQNGGSFRAAAEEFMRVADECDTYEQFSSRYSVFDYGENHQQREGKTSSHDNFIVQNINADGYSKIKSALRAFLDSTG
ncbi:hypothetical protein IJG26_02990 [Candidatus Saccharibacteria bacterium]|nr:hypothetical protein [Candidatus Saccharibacteria bacterium]